MKNRLSEHSVQCKSRKQAAANAKLLLLMEKVHHTASEKSCASMGTLWKQHDKGPCTKACSAELFCLPRVPVVFFIGIP